MPDAPFDADIRADGGAGAETPIIGRHCLVLVDARAATLTPIAAAGGFTAFRLGAWMLRSATGASQ